MESYRGPTLVLCVIYASALLQQVIEGFQVHKCDSVNAGLIFWPGTVGNPTVGQLNTCTGYYLTMITEDQKYVLSEGESVTLLCDFHAQYYNLFDYPVLWKKSQHGEVQQVNIMGNINEPFAITRRFQVNFSQNPPMHRFELLVTNVVPGDSGNYTCEVRGPESVLLSTVTHHVFVRAPVESLMLTASNYTDDRITLHYYHRPNRQITMMANTLNTLRCVARGGYPAPQLTVLLVTDDISGVFHHKSRPTLNGEPGLRVITYTTALWTDSFIPSAEQDGDEIKCVASVSGLKSHITTLRLIVHYAPKIECHNQSVYPWDRNVALLCEIWSKPDVTSLFWVIDDNGTTLYAQDVINEFWILEVDKDGNYQKTKLFMRQAKPDNFRTYTIVAENSVAATSHNVQLLKKNPTMSGKSSRDTSSSRQSGDGYSHGLPLYNSSLRRTVATSVLLTLVGLTRSVLQ